MIELDSPQAILPQAGKQRPCGRLIVIGQRDCVSIAAFDQAVLRGAEESGPTMAHDDRR